MHPLLFVCCSNCINQAVKDSFNLMLLIQLHRFQPLCQRCPSNRSVHGNVGSQDSISTNFVSANMKMSIFAEKECHFSPDSIQVYTALTTTSLVGLKPVKP